MPRRAMRRPMEGNQAYEKNQKSSRQGSRTTGVIWHRRHRFPVIHLTTIDHRSGIRRPKIPRAYHGRVRTQGRLGSHHPMRLPTWRASSTLQTAPGTHGTSIAPNMAVWARLLTIIAAGAAIIARMTRTRTIWAPIIVSIATAMVPMARAGLTRAGMAVRHPAARRSSSNEGGRPSVRLQIGRNGERSPWRLRCGTGPCRRWRSTKLH